MQSHSVEEAAARHEVKVRRPRPSQRRPRTRRAARQPSLRIPRGPSTRDHRRALEREGNPPPGIEERGFRYRTAAGAPIDAADRERIDALKVPPAWRTWRSTLAARLGAGGREGRGGALAVPVSREAGPPA